MASSPRTLALRLALWTLAGAGCTGEIKPLPGVTDGALDLAMGSAGDRALPPGDLAEAPADLAMVTPADLAPAGYPQGPYGSKVGETIWPLSWEGYVNDTAVGLADTRPYGPYSMDQLRRSVRAYALVHVSEFL